MVGTVLEQSKGEEISPAESAESFPKSHQILYRDFSDASSVLSDFEKQQSSALENLIQDLKSKSLEQSDSPHSVLSEEGKLEMARGHAPIENGKACISHTEVAKSLQENGVASTASLSKLSTLAEQGSTVSATSTDTDGPDDNMEDSQLKRHKETAHRETGKTAGTKAEIKGDDPQKQSDKSLDDQIQEGDQKVRSEDKSNTEEEDLPKSENVEEENNLAAAPGTPNQKVLAKKDSESSLSPASEPFVPSAYQSSKEEDKFKTPTRTWNVNAAAFVPSGQSGHSETTPSDISNSDHISWPNHTPVQFGTLPDSLTASPLPTSSSHDNNQDWKAEKYAYSPQNLEHSPGYQGQDWNGGWNGQYSIGSFYTDANGHTYVCQEDGTWAYYDMEAAWRYQNGHDSYEIHSERHTDETEGKLRPRQKSERRWKDRQWNRGSEAALAEVLAKSFRHSSELVHSVIDLHEGSLRGILDTLGQLEAESKGLLLTDHQDAPELNEENFPSLGSSGKSEDQNKVSEGKAGFANVVKASPSSPPHSPQMNGKGAESPKIETETKFWHDEDVSSEDFKAAANGRASHEANLRDELFEKAMWAAYERDYESANAWASQGMKHSEEVIKACVEAETVLYKHRYSPPRRRANRLIGPLDLIGLSEKEAIQTLEEELRRLTTKKNRSSRVPDQKLSLLLGSQKELKSARSMPLQLESWLKASPFKYNKTEPGFIELFL